MTQGKTGLRAPAKNSFVDTWLPRLSWVVAVGMFMLMVALLLRRAQTVFSATPSTGQQSAASSPAAIPANSAKEAPLPGYDFSISTQSLARSAELHTIIPSRPRTGVVKYRVEKGDSIFSISQKYKLKPETILWANYDLLDDNPNMLSIGQDLTIAPVDGVLYKWKAGDALDKIAGQYKVEPDDIIMYPGNQLDMTNPVIEPDTLVMIPGGWRENRQWLVPTIWRSNAGATRAINGPGACDLPSGGYVGSGSFIWPSGNHFLSGNDYWSGHLGIDIAAATGTPLAAVDSGQVVYAGSIGGGYGLMVMLDHGNGYHSLYAHLDSIIVKCGQSVSQGSIIAYSGNSGNSTGPHLHFEIRYNGGFINPWYVLP